MHHSLHAIWLAIVSRVASPAPPSVMRHLARRSTPSLFACGHAHSSNHGHIHRYVPETVGRTEAVWGQVKRGHRRVKAWAFLCWQQVCFGKHL